MTEWVQVVVLALIQGITEFLPVSSSAHLILPAQIWGWVDQGLLFDVAVHAGTLCAVLWYFRDTVINLAKSLLPGGPSDRSELWALVVATVPVVLAGLLFRDVIATDVRAVNVIVVTTLLFGVLLGVADRLSRRGAGHTGPVSLRDALLIGLAQMFAPDPRDIAIRCDDHSCLVSGLPSCRRRPLLIFAECAGDWGRRSADAGDHGVRRIIAVRWGGFNRIRALGDVCLRHDQSLYGLG